MGDNKGGGGGAFGPSVQNQERRSAASPLGDDVLKILQGIISEGAFGQGVGPMQRNAGTAIQQFVSSLQSRSTGNVNTAGALQNNTGGLISALEKGSATRANRQAGDLRELYGAAGTRYGSSIAKGEGMLRGDIASNLDQLIGGIQVEQAAREQGAREFDVTANETQRQNLDASLLSGISTLFGMGEANIAPILAMAAAGILPPEVIASPGVGSQLLTGLFSGLGAYLESGGRFGIGGNNNQAGNRPMFGGTGENFSPLGTSAMRPNSMVLPSQNTMYNFRLT